MSNRNKALIVVGVALLVIAGIAFLVGGWLAGWDFVAFFQGPTFIWICVFLGLYGLGVGALLVYEKIKKL